MKSFSDRKDPWLIPCYGMPHGAHLGFPVSTCLGLFPMILMLTLVGRHSGFPTYSHMILMSCHFLSCACSSVGPYSVGNRINMYKLYPVRICAITTGTAEPIL